MTYRFEKKVYFDIEADDLLEAREVASLFDDAVIIGECELCDFDDYHVGETSFVGHAMDDEEEAEEELYLYLLG